MKPYGAPDPYIKFRKYITPRFGIPGDSCLYTISVGASKQQTSDLVCSYMWALKTYNITAILLGDGLYRITLQICHGLPDCDAQRECILAGENLLRQVLDGIGKPDLQIFKTSELLEHQEFADAYRKISQLYKESRLFRKSVISDAVTFVARQHKNAALNSTKLKALRLSVTYLIEEIAVYLLMAQRGWLTEIYLGHEMPTLAMLMNNDIPGAPKALKQRVNIGIEMKVKKRRPRQEQSKSIPQAA